MTSNPLDIYWYFAYERQNIFFSRILDIASPFTNDKILQSYSFTNTYRASDRTSQYLIREVIYSGDYGVEDLVFRIFLFKMFNSIPTWQALEKELGPLVVENYSFEKFHVALSKIKLRNGTIYSPAYIMPSGKSSFGYAQKHKNNLRLLELILKDELHKKLQDSNSLKEVYHLLLSYPTLGKFLAFQYAIDLNYSTLIDFDEGDFVVAGPGAASGIEKCFGTTVKTPESIIYQLTDNQEEEFNTRELQFRNLWGRNLQPIDIQNVFCEVDKYCRIALPGIGRSQRTRIKRKFTPKESIDVPWYAPKWGLNKAISDECSRLT